MPIIGKLIKKGSAISHKISKLKGEEYTKQLLVLKKLINSAKQTQFGFAHSYLEILKNPDLVNSFQKKVPLTEYEAFYDKWLRKVIGGEKEVTWPGRVKYFALSSGTTGSPSKRIPVTEKMIRSFQRTSIRQLATLHEIDLPDVFFSSQVLAIGGSTRLIKKKNHIEGDLSGILKKHTSIVATPFTKPGTRISSIKDWNKKIERIVENAPKWNIGIIAGIPSWCIMLMEKIITHYNLKSIHDIWPNLHVYIHGGVYMDPYIDKLNALTSHKINLLDTYLASEGYFAFQKSIHKKSMNLLLDSGVFYEFIPFNSEYFDSEGCLKNKNKALTLNQVQEGVDYALVISTNAGLWRYIIGDLIKFVNVNERELIISGRIKQFLSLCGEHLSLENINEALLKLSKTEKTEIIEYTIFADENSLNHHWFISLKTNTSTKKFSSMLDEELSKLNDDYKSARKYTLGKPKVEFLPVNVFYDYLNSIGKSGSQNKFPRVLNKKQADQWLKYISKR